MANTPSPHQPMKPLSVGNVVSASLRIYRDHFQSYYLLALKAYPWLLVPIYGWAKFAAISGLISRLAFQEVIEKPESKREAMRHINPRMWQFFVSGLLVFLIIFATLLVEIIVLGIGVAIFSGVLQGIIENRLVVILIAILLPIVVIIVFLGVYIWVYSRVSIPEVAIAIEGLEGSASIGRSWNLTKGSVVRLQLIYFVAVLITIPVSFVIQIASTIIQLVFPLIFPQDSSIFALFYFLCIFGLSVAGGAVFVPFWQIIKAVIYYDLRSRREGIDISLRDRS